MQEPVFHCLSWVSIGEGAYDNTVQELMAEQQSLIHHDMKDLEKSRIHVHFQYPFQEDTIVRQERGGRKEENVMWGETWDFRVAS